MSNVKGKGQRLIPEELLRYLESLKNKYPDAVDLVEANPTLEGGEDSLSSVLINGTKYAVGGGSDISLYQHNIYLKSFFTDNRKFSCSVISKNETPFSVNTFMDFLLSNGFDANTKLYPVCTTNIIGIFYDNGGITGVGQTDQLSFGLPNDYSLTDVVIKVL